MQAPQRFAPVLHGDTIDLETVSDRRYANCQKSQQSIHRKRTGSGSGEQAKWTISKHLGDTVLYMGVRTREYGESTGRNRRFSCRPTGCICYQGEQSASGPR